MAAVIRLSAGERQPLPLQPAPGGARSRPMQAGCGLCLALVTFAGDPLYNCNNAGPDP
jgi:hypothetical protein